MVILRHGFSVLVDFLATKLQFFGETMSSFDAKNDEGRAKKHHFAIFARPFSLSAHLVRRNDKT